MRWTACPSRSTSTARALTPAQTAAAIYHLQQVGGLFDVERSEQEVTDDQDARALLV